jgi:hypothetical protein
MLQIGLASMLLFAATAQGPAARAVVSTARQDYFADKLTQTVNFDGFDDPKMTLQDALEYLTDRYDLAFEIDRAAFAKFDVKNAAQFEIAREPIEKARGVRLKHVLNKIVARLPEAAEPTFIFQGDAILVTTRKAASKRILGDENRPLPPLVHFKFENQPLKLALDDVAGLTDTAVVLDDSIAEKAGETVSARFVNTPVDSAVRVLAGRYNFTSLRIDGVIYVTTREKAAKLREDMEKEGKKEAPRRMPLADEKP